MAVKMPLGLRIAIIDRAFRRKMDEWAEEIGITAVQLRVLGEVSLMEDNGVEEVNQKDLEHIEQVTHPTMTGIIKRLEAKGFLIYAPSENDRRYKKISCTEKSRGIHKEIAKKEALVVKEMCKDFTPEQMETFLQMTEMMLQNIS